MTKLVGPSFLICTLLIAASSLTAQQALDPDAPGSCSTQIAKCGCVITKSNTYIVTQNLSASQTNKANCIEIAADHSVLNLKSHQLIGKGNGTGIGILIDKGADHVVIEGADEKQGEVLTLVTDPATCDLDGAAQGVVTAWNVGIEDDGDDAVIQLFTNIGGFPGEQPGNSVAGLFMNGVNRSFVAGVNACYNGTAGVLVRNSSGVTLLNASVFHNGTVGTWLDSTKDSNLTTSGSMYNGKYGTWIMRSSRNLVANYGGNLNGIGTLIGCGDVHCTGQETSDDNKITFGGNNANTLAGILIQKKNRNNIVTVTTNGGNNGHDMVDQNPNCDSNIWYNNIGHADETCIH